MVNDNPLMSELERMADFCRETPKVFIYQLGETQKLISKYLAMSDLHIAGFIKPEVYEGDRANEAFPIYNFAELHRKFLADDVGIILSTADEVFSQEIENFKLIGIHKFFLVSSWNRHAIPMKMRPRRIENFPLEVNLADHCNLNCQCCDHFSPLATETFYDFEQYKKDIQRLAKLSGGGVIGLLKLQGGEPLLNTKLLDFIKVSRKTFPNSPICIFTDGLLLAKLPDVVWQSIHDDEIEVRMTHYPIPLNLDSIKERAATFDIPVTFDAPLPGKCARIWVFSEIGDTNYHGIKHSVKHPFDLSGQQEKYRWISCYQFNESQVLRDGKIYTCPMIPYVHYFNDYFHQNLPVKDDCYIDIYKAKSIEEITEFCTHRVSFCDYCAIHKRHALPWRQSAHSMDEWV